MKYFLDTESCLCFLKGTSTKFLENIRRQNPDDIKIPSLVKAELGHAAERSAERQKNLELVARFLLPLEIVDFNDAAAAVYARIRSRLKDKGKTTGAHALIIAATVLAARGVLVTENKKEYGKIAELKMENWLT
jgi:tRNA(fMet)-specific endonuclease VapC